MNFSELLRFGEEGIIYPFIIIASIISRVFFKKTYNSIIEIANTVRRINEMNNRICNDLDKVKEEEYKIESALHEIGKTIKTNKKPN